jgi:hypothetical protein
LENVNLSHFSYCDLLHKTGSEIVPFQSVHPIEMIDSLAENFIMRFSDFRSRFKNTRIFENPFSVEFSDAPEKF